MPAVLNYAKPGPESAWRIVLGRLNFCFLLLGFWIAQLLSPLWVFVIGFMVAGILVRLTSKPASTVKVAVAALILSPMTVSMGRASVDYLSATATLHDRGLMRGSSPVDRATRLRATSRGCVSFGDEWMSDTPYNMMLTFCVKAFGPMKGSYAGPYPDEPAARAGLIGAKGFDLKQLPTDTLLVDGRVIQLRVGLGNEIMKAFREGPATNILDDSLIKRYGQARATLYGGQCVVLAIPNDFPVAGMDFRPVILIDADTGKVFGSYGRYQRYPMSR